MKKFIVVLVILSACILVAGCEEYKIEEYPVIEPTPVSMFRARTQGLGDTQQVLFQFAFEDDFRFSDFNIMDYADSEVVDAYVTELERILDNRARETWLENDIIFFARHTDGRILTSVRNRLWSQHLNLVSDRDDRASEVVRIGKPHMGMSGVVIVASVDNSAIENTAGVIDGERVSAGDEWEAVLVVIEGGEVFHHSVRGVGPGSQWV